MFPLDSVLQREHGQPRFHVPSSETPKLELTLRLAQEEEGHAGIVVLVLFGVFDRRLFV
jgi:hypothetical protein